MTTPSPDHKPVILCDVNNTILIHEFENEKSREFLNEKLMQQLSKAMEQGFHVQLCSEAIDRGEWYSNVGTSFPDIGVPKALIDNVCGKEGIADRYQGRVVAIIDNNDDEKYIKEVMETSPKAKFFEPFDIRTLQVHLSREAPSQTITQRAA